MLILVLVCAAIVAVVSSVGETCDGGKGTCIDTSVELCLNGQGTLKTGYCPGANNILCCEPGIIVPGRCQGSGPGLPAGAFEVTLQNQGFDGHSGAVVYFPSNFNFSSTENLEVVVYIHGYNNCIRNIVRDASMACNCSEGQDLRSAFDLINIFEETVGTKLTKGIDNHLFIALEVAYDQANDSPGRWAEEGLFAKFFAELFDQDSSSSQQLPSNKLTLQSIARIRLFSHSGGYYTIGNLAIVGGMSQQVQDVCLLDSLYADFAQFDEYVQGHLANQDLGTGLQQYRFSSIYTMEGGTYENNQAMLQQSLAWLNSSGTSASTSLLYYDNSLDGDLGQDKVIATYPLIFKLSNLTHDETASHYFELFLKQGL